MTTGLRDGGDRTLGRADLEEKLQIRRGQTVAVINAPPESGLRLLAACRPDPDRADVVVGFATRPVDLACLKSAYTAAQAGRPAWIGYPTPGRPGTDLRREWLLRALRQYGVHAVRDVVIDHAWSALALRPAGDRRHPGAAAPDDEDHA